MDQQFNILIVDRDTNARESLRDLLETEGYFSSATSPEEAPDLLQSAEGPCIVLLHTLGSPKNGLQHLAVLEHEQYLLGIAWDVLQESRAIGMGQLFQDARARELHPIHQLLPTSAETRVFAETG
jgi:CheY-like chemotaxis protein